VILTVACHDRAALARAKALGADAAFLSPVFPTASHPGARGLGGLRAALLARQAGLPVLALGGVSARRAAALTKQGFRGFAAVRGWAHPAAER
jgi:thiamine-phosphate pyrophosphorylase